MANSQTMSMAEAIIKAEGNLSTLSFDEISEMYEVFTQAGVLGQREQAAFKKLQDFAKQEITQAAAKGTEVDMTIAPELDAWLMFLDKVDMPEKTAVKGKLSQFYKYFDKEHNLQGITPNSADMLEKNHKYLEQIQTVVNPLQKGKNKDEYKEFAKIIDFYDSLKIHNKAEGDRVSKNSFKQDMFAIAALEAKTELLQDKNFANLSVQDRIKKYKEVLKRHLEQDIGTLLLAQMHANFYEQNIGILAEIKDTNLSEEERNKKKAEYQQKAKAFSKETSDYLAQITQYFATDGAKKPQIIDISNTIAASIVIENSSNALAVNKRIAQKSGFKAAWKKAKAFDKKMAEKYPKTWSVAKGLALSVTASTTLGVVGVALVGVYKARKACLEVADKAEKNGQGFWTYLKNNKVEAAKFGVSAASAMISVGFAGFDVAMQGISAAGIVGQMAEHTARHGGDIAAGVSEWASNISSNASTNTAGSMASKVIDGGWNGLWEGIKHHIIKPKTLLRTGVALCSAGVAYASNLSKGTKEAKKAALTVLGGTSLGLLIGGVASEMSGSGNVEKPESAQPDTQPQPEKTDVQTPESEKQTPKPTTPVEEKPKDLTPRAVREEHVPQHRPQIDAEVLAADKEVFAELVKRNAFIVRHECQYHNMEEFKAALMAQSKIDMAYYQQLLNSGKVAEAEHFMKALHDKAERYEGHDARTVTEDDSRKLKRAKLKAQKSYNEYMEKRNTLSRMDRRDADYVKAEKELDEARMKYAKNMVKLTDKKCQDLIKDIKEMEKSGQGQEYAETKGQLQAVRYVLKHGDKVNEELLDETIDKCVGGMSDYKKSTLSAAVARSISSRNR